MSGGGQANLPIQTGLSGHNWGTSHPPANKLRHVPVERAEMQKKSK